MPRKKDRKINETDRAFYKMGLLDGERRQRQRYAETLALLKRTNNVLWRELCRLDITLPTEGVLIPFPVIKRLIKSLRKPGDKNWYARKLAKMLKEAQNERFTPL